MNKEQLIKKYLEDSVRSVFDHPELYKSEEDMEKALLSTLKSALSPRRRYRVAMIHDESGKFLRADVIFDEEDEEDGQ